MKLTKQQLAVIKKMDEPKEQLKRDSFLAIQKSGIKFHMEQLIDDESRRDFLTEIFGLTEELRHELSVGEAFENEIENRTLAVSSTPILDKMAFSERKERSPEDSKREQVNE